MQELGWVEGQHLTVERRYAEGHDERLPVLAAELVQLKVDLILAIGPRETQAAKTATDTIPIVFTSAGDPVRQGLVTSLAHPGGKVTGLSIVSPELTRKRLELLKEAVPGSRRVAVLTNAGVNYLLAELTPAAESLGVTLYPCDAPTADELDRAFAAMRPARVDALLVLSAPLFYQQVRRIVELAATYGLPTLYPFSSFVNAGGLMSYGPSNAHRWRLVARYVDKILKGAKPADLPVEQPMEFDLVINLKAAQALGITIPPLLLFQATTVIR
jgi:putative ABC transport system substrate-binding protein